MQSPLECSRRSRRGGRGGVGAWARRWSQWHVSRTWPQRDLRLVELLRVALAQLEVDHVLLDELNAGELHALARGHLREYGLHLREDGTVCVGVFEQRRVVGKLPLCTCPLPWAATRRGRPAARNRWPAALSSHATLGWLWGRRTWVWERSRRLVAWW